MVIKNQSSNVSTASQWRLIWWKFSKHKLAIYSAYFLVILYIIGAFCEFFAPYSHIDTRVEYLHAPPQRLRFIGPDGFSLRPFVYRLTGVKNPQTLENLYIENHNQPDPVRFFVRGNHYKLWRLLPTNIHLFGVENGGTVFLLGTDSLGRDLFSRILYGARISLTIGLVGVFLSFVFGIIMGAISGYYGGLVDHCIQRIIEVLRSFPAIPLWMGLSAALPATWSGLQIYFGITLVLAVVGWTGLARIVRGRILTLREEDYCLAAKLCGASMRRIMFRHLVPNFTSHIIASITLSIPAMILSETALNFLGIGLRPPITSWGVLLKEAQNIQAIAHQPWLLTPVFFVILTVLSFNFIGDGMRDAADPYSR